jgi:succinate-semialdehyde dehydrogenase/glutarate-semialdehyde dehydrogenase
MKTINPATEAVLAEYNLLNAQALNQTLNQVALAQLQWRRVFRKERVACIQALATKLRDNAMVSAQMITAEMGKPISQALAELEKCARLCDYYANHADDLLAVETMAGSYVEAQPLGVILGIMPWNFPFWQVLRFAIPNLLLGNTVVIKHAPNTFGSAELLQQWFLAAGFPPASFQNLLIDVDLVPAVIQHPAIVGVSLTGSARAGRVVAALAGQALKKVVLELGGSDAYLILNDADLALAAKQCVLSRLSNAGQICIAAKRIIVEAPIYAEFIERLQKAAEPYMMGDPTQNSCLLGPLARADLRQHVHQQVESLKASGAHCLMGGELPLARGYYYPATLFTDVSSNSIAFSEEIFGPVLAVTKAPDVQAAIELANASPYGLAAAIFSQNSAEAERLARESLMAGTVAVNHLVMSDPRLPFGGIKNSGFGRELGLAGIREFANLKTISLD